MTRHASGGSGHAKARPALATAAALCLLAALIGAGLAAGSSRAATRGSNLDPTELAPQAEVNRDIPNSQSQAHVPSAHVPRPTSTPVNGPGPGFSFLGLNFADQRTADARRQFSLEPPDQGLCVNDTGYVMEAVNDVFTFYQGGMPVYPPMALNPFFIGDHAIIRGAAPIFGTFVSDPKCYFDPELKRFFFTVLSIDRNSSTGAFLGPTHVEIAVSKTAMPSTNRTDWYFYRINTTNTGPDAANPNLPSNANCPCLGDQPLIGADKYGFFVSTNEFPLFADGFNGGIVYAMDKAALTLGSLHNLTILANHPPLAEGPGYSIQPATSPTPADWQTANGGTEYFLSALDFDATLDNRIAAWAATNTQSLTTSSPNVRLTNVVLPSEVYGQPPDAEQKSGPYPLGQSLKEHENLLAANDDRMQQTVYVRPPGGDPAGKLFSGLNTVVKTENGPTHVGIAWFIVTPSVTGSGSTTQVSGAVANQGYVAVNQENVMYPAIGVNHAGRGAMAFTLVGPGYYPSAADTTIDLSGTGPTVNVPGPGQRPADGFSGYRFYGGSGVERWGDYSAAVADASGTIWMATEYIQGDVMFPPFLANWDTRVISFPR